MEDDRIRLVSAADHAKLQTEKKLFEVEESKQRAVGRLEEEVRRVREAAAKKEGEMEEQLRKERTARVKLVQSGFIGGEGGGGGREEGREGGRRWAAAMAPNPEGILRWTDEEGEGGREGGREGGEEGMSLETLEGAREEIARLRRRVGELEEEVEENDNVELMNRLVSIDIARTRELGAVKQLLLKVGQEYPDVVDTKWMCEATEQEVIQALRAHNNNNSSSSSSSNSSSSSIWDCLDFVPDHLRH